MPDTTISAMTQVAYKSTMLLPLVDMTAPTGLKNLTMTLGNLFAAFSTGGNADVSGLAVTPEGSKTSITVGAALGGDAKTLKVSATTGLLGIAGASEPAGMAGGVAVLAPSGSVTQSSLALLRSKTRTAALSNPRSNPAMTTPPEIFAAGVYLASTAYAVGQYAFSGGNFYRCVTAGTTGASSAPTGTGASIADGTVVWAWALANPAQVIASDNAAFIAKGGETIYSPTPPTVGSARQCQVITSIPDFNNEEYTYQTIEFDADAQTIVLFCQAPGTPTNMRVKVNGQYASFTPLANLMPSVGGDYYLVVSFAERALNRIEIEALDYFTYMWIGQTESVSYPTYDKCRAFLFGDSYSFGGGVWTFGVGTVTNSIYYAYNYIMCDLLGISDLWNDAIGGTGYTVGGTGLTFVDRLPDLTNVAAEPDVIIFAGGHNDVGGGAYPASVQAAVATCIQSARTAYPNTPIIVFGVFAGTLNAQALCTTIEQAIEAAVTQVADGNTYFLPCHTDPLGPWFTGTGYQGATTGTGNCDALISADGVHPNVYGHEYLARKCAIAVSNLLAGLGV